MTGRSARRPLPTVVPADKAILERIVETTPPFDADLSREALAKYQAAQAKTAWALDHRHPVALVQGSNVLASAVRYDLAGILDGQPVTICGIGAGFNGGHHDGDHRGALVEQLLEGAARDGADLALLMTSVNAAAIADGFEAVPIRDVELTVTESSRRGAPMTLVRAGEDRDLDAIAAMGRIRAGQFRFHLDRSVNFIKHAITRQRLLAGFAPAGSRQLEFVIAEEGITAAADLVISVVGKTWTLEECGDRDPSGARVGALLQALIAREPVESRPLIRGWLPPGFRPPQVTIASAAPAPAVLFTRGLTARGQQLRLAIDDVLYWRNDLF